MVCIPAWSFYKLSTLKGPFREVWRKAVRGRCLVGEVGPWMMVGCLLGQELVHRGASKSGMGVTKEQSECLAVSERDWVTARPRL